MALLIIDFGSQYTQLIAKQMRKLGVYSLVITEEELSSHLDQGQVDAVILSGSHASIVSPLSFLDDLIQRNIPILGICYGLQAIAFSQKGGQVQHSEKREFGHQELTIQKKSPLLSNIPANSIVWMSHGDHVSQAPIGFECIASTASCPFAVLQHLEKKIYGVQFHPEVTHTEYGQTILYNFAIHISGCERSWKNENIMSSIVKDIQTTVGNQDHVLLALSGGTDSAVAAGLLQRAIGDRLHCVFVNHGLLRKEDIRNLNSIQESCHINVKIIDAQDRFLNALAHASDPEEKRKIIAHLFIDVFTEYAQESQITYLAQGTIYSDVIESAKTKNGKNVLIKSHHNVGGLPDSLSMPLIEPLRFLFKDEVRDLGLHLGIPKQILWQHPFPGPGLATRVLGCITREALHILRGADAIWLDILRKYQNPDSKKTWYEEVSQAFAIFLPVRSVGVMGDGRTYDYVICLRAICTQDFMTASPARLPHTLLEEAASTIINEIPGINRVVFDFSSKPPATIEWE